MKNFSRLILALAVLMAPLVASSAARAQDDEMPDGDADLAEKPKKDAKKREEEKKKKEEAKKEEAKKKEEDQRKKDEAKAKKEEEAKRKEEAKKKPPPPADDDDILTGDDPPPRTAPKKEEPKTTKDPLLESVLVDDDEDDLPSRAREPVKEERAPLPTTKLEEEPPSRTNRSVNVHSDEPPPEPELAPIVPVEKPSKSKRRDGDDVKSIDTPIEEPDETEGAPTGLIVGGAIGGAVVVLAGAGVGGYFLVQALQGGGGGTVVITPH